MASLPRAFITTHSSDQVEGSRDHAAQQEAEANGPRLVEDLDVAQKLAEEYVATMEGMVIPEVPISSTNQDMFERRRKLSDAAAVPFFDDEAQFCKERFDEHTVSS